MNIPFIQKSSLLLLSPPPGGSLIGIRRFSLPLFIENQWVLGVVGLTVGECLDVEPCFVVLLHAIYPQESSEQLQRVSGCRSTFMKLS